MSDTPIGQPLAEITVSPLRRFIGAAAVAVSGTLLLGTAMFEPPQGAVLQVLVWALALVLLISAFRLYRDTGLSVMLTNDALIDSSGEVIVALENIVEIERGHFTFRPSNGFSLKLNAEATPRWRVGLWWRAGQRAAVGGASSAAQAKKMAETLEKHLGLSVLPD